MYLYALNIDIKYKLSCTHRYIGRDVVDVSVFNMWVHDRLQPLGSRFPPFNVSI